VVLPGGELVLESGDPDFDPAPLASALTGTIAPPYRAVGVRRGDLWAVGAVSIQVERLDPDPRGTDLELTWTGTSQTLLIDGMPADASEQVALAGLAAARERGAYSAHAHRIADDLWEVLVLPL